MMIRRYFLLSCLLVLLGLPVGAQVIAVKTNVLGDALRCVNVGVEMAFAPRWTLDLYGSANAWTLDSGKRWKHLLIQPEARYWFCEPFGGHFIGFHMHGGKYNVGGFDGKVNMLGSDLRKIEANRYQGWLIGAGVAYGYDWMLGRHWNMEAEIGFGWAYTQFDRFRCVGCGKKEAHDQSHNYVGPTKAALNLVYVF